MNTPTAIHRRTGRARTRTVRLVTALTAALLVASCTSSGSEPASSGTTASSEAKAELFDASVVHAISIDYDQSDYDKMIDAFATSGAKDWIEVTATVDGVRYERAGLRLKGNSSLMGLGRNQSPATGAGGEPTSTTTEGTTSTAPANPPDNAPGGLPGLGSRADAGSPERLPWLIRLDQFVEQQRHQGYADIVVRSNTSKTSLNEAVALDLLDATTLKSQLAVSTSFAVNGGEPILRLAIEHPDDDAWQERSFSSPGALYKAESSGNWSYRGDDPNAYADVFDQEGGKKITDLTPLIDFLEFINQSDDATFAAELPKRLDVDAFATYLALMDLTGNFDDIDGPGNNAYLWWDQASGSFTIVPWDMNLAFGAMASMIPGGMANGGNPPAGFDPANRPGGAAPPAAGGGQAGPFGRTNTLVTRFHANPDFESRYQQKVDSFRTDLFATSAATTTLDVRVKTLQTVADLVDQATLQQESDALRQQFKTTAEAS